MLDPTTILIPPSRQRKRGLGDLTSLRESIREFGIINPITVRQDFNGDGEPVMVLVAGHRRLQCCIDLSRGLATGEFRWWEDLSADEAHAIELEENVKREDLHWRDRVEAYGKIHGLKSARAKALEEPWSIESTAHYLGISKQHLGDILIVHRQIDSPIISDADSFSQAFARLQRESERQAVSIVNELASVGAEAFGERPLESTGLSPLPLPDGEFTGPELAIPDQALINPSIPILGQVQELYTTSTVSVSQPKPHPILVTDFNTWAKAYSGPKFTFIHCDFPYGIDYTNYGNSILQTGPELYTKEAVDYRELTNSFCVFLDHFCSYSAHVMFWFSMTYYEWTKKRLESAGLFVHEHPLIWHKTDNAGIIPGRDNQYLRRTYETAFICSRGKRPFVKLIANSYGAPTQSNAVHPSVKPEPVLRHFFQATIDSTTDLLDPTCGSASAILAAESPLQGTASARSVLGLEINPNFAKLANDSVELARTKRRLAGG